MTSVIDAERPAIRQVSLMAPMWNEANHIEDFIHDVANQDFDGDLELIVADGQSTDGSREILVQAARLFDVPVTIVDNPARWVSAGLNLCLAEARGDLVVRLDCHSRYPVDYVRRCVLAAEETGADNVGGVMIAVGQTPLQRAVATAMDSPFGGIHWTRHGSVERVDCDTVPYGAFRPDVFSQIGLFDEDLVRNQDDEFNLRLRLAGGRIVLDPSIRTYYSPRTTLSSLFRQYYEYGLWKVPVMLKHRKVLSARSLAPPAFVASLVGLAVATPLSSVAAVLLAIETIAYLAAASFFAASAVNRRGESRSLLGRVMLVFAAFHFAYGTGMLTGWLRVALRRAPAASPATSAS